MNKLDSSAMFQPLKIGSIEIKNRIIMAPMLVHTPEITNDDGSFTEAGIAYFLERAKGGAGLITTGAMQVTNRFERMSDGAYLSRNRESYIAHMKPLAEGAHQYGAKVFVQMSAGFGRCFEPGLGPSYEYVSASDGIPNVWHPEEKSRAMTIEEIHFIIKKFGECAKMVKDAGLDGVQVHAVHEGYLLDQFAMSCSNHRTDEYGGSLENRLRFATDIVHEIKRTCGKDFPVSIRFSARSMMKGFGQDLGAVPGEEFTEFGRDMDEAFKVAKILENAGYDMLDMDNGSHDAWHYCHPPVYMPEACNMQEASAIKQTVKIPVSCSGKMNVPAIASEAISSGKLDAVTVGRAFLADPDWPNKLMAGDVEDIRPCINCYEGCGVNHAVDGHPGPACAVNKQTGKETVLKITKAPKTKKVLVIGGGISGMEAARVSALRGHSVTLVEKSSRLGGMFIAASSMTFKERDRGLISWYIYQMKKLGVNVRLNSTINADNIGEFKADEVFVATGSTENRIRFPGAETNRVFSSTEILTNRSLAGDNIVVIGGGLTGQEIAYDFAKEGKTVTILELASKTLESPLLISDAYRLILPLLLNQFKVKLVLNAHTQKITEDSVEYTVGDKLYSVKADTVVLSVGLRSNNKLAQELENVGQSVHVIGDAGSVANILYSVWTAYQAAYNI